MVAGGELDCIISESFALRFEKGVKRSELPSCDGGMRRRGTSAMFGWVSSFQKLEKLGLKMVSGRPSHVAQVRTPRELSKSRKKTRQSAVVESAGNVGGSRIEHIWELMGGGVGEGETFGIAVDIREVCESVDHQPKFIAVCPLLSYLAPRDFSRVSLRKSTTRFGSSRLFSCFQ